MKLLRVGRCTVRHRVARQAAYRRQPMTLERLEPRLLLYNVVSSWANPNVSASFLPDGTSSEGYASNLYTTLNLIAPTTTWQREFARALQTWANSSNLNFHFVSDSGSDSGTSGSAQGDTRFGDIRLGAHVLGGYLGYAYYPISAGTSGGDITLDTTTYAFHIGSNYDLFSVLLHESGHAVGLGHSTSGTVMAPSYGGILAGLSADDIAGIQAIYGARQADAYDAGASNNTLASASALTLDSNGAATANADLTSMGDVDYYRVTVPTGDGTLTVSLDTRDISLLAPKLLVYDSAGNLVTSADTGSVYESMATVDLSGLVAGETYYLVADRATTDVFGMGAYRLDVQFGGVTPPPPPPPPPALSPDRYEVNDTMATAKDFGKINSLSQTGLTVHNSSDVDYYSFVARSTASFKVSALFAQANGNLDVTIYDAQGNLLASGTSLGDNEVLNVSLVSGKRYYIKAFGANGAQNTYDLKLEKIATSGGGKKGGLKVLKGDGFDVAPGDANQPHTAVAVPHDNSHASAPKGWQPELLQQLDSILGSRQHNSPGDKTTEAPRAPGLVDQVLHDNGGNSGGERWSSKDWVEDIARLFQGIF